MKKALVCSAGGFPSTSSGQAWRGGREKAPAAICRKVAIAEDGGTIPVWGDGTAIRAYTYVDDLVEGVYMLMQADPARHPELVEGPGGMLAIVGGDEYVTVDEVAFASLLIR